MPPNITPNPAPKTPPDAKSDPREPDTELDKLDPETYGFRTIDTEGVKEAYAAGPGSVDPERHESVTGPDQTTMRDRAKLRDKAQNTTVDKKDVDTK